jgi:apolipoprotein D and lipocalin family protein
MKTKLSLAAMLISLAIAACVTKESQTTVAHVDLKRYAGTWHEIARYPNWFQRHCVRDVTAEYVPQEDGSIRVINRCRKADGTFEQSVARATIVPHSGNAKLKVSFFGPFTGDYWIIGLDEENYSWAMVGHPSHKYLWILSRSPTLPAEIYEHILRVARAAGYHPDKLMRTDQ